MRKLIVLSVLITLLRVFCYGEVKEMEVLYITAPTPTAEATDSLLTACGIDYHPIDTVNWKEFPYKPETLFRLAYTDDAILLEYKVKELDTTATMTEDNASVWRDSCVEFFFGFPEESGYYNLECNCIGAVLMEYGEKSYPRVKADAETLGEIKRFSTLGRKAFKGREGETEWKLSLMIPFQTLFRHDVKSLKGREMRANFYKCGLSLPHYVTWTPVDMPKPQFHSPDYFGTLRF